MWSERQSAAVLSGSIASMDSQYILALRAKNCSTGDIVADEQAQVARKEDVLGWLSQMAARFARNWVNRSPPSKNTPNNSRSDDAIVGRVESVHAHSGVFSSGGAPAVPLFGACDRDRPGLRGRPCAARNVLQQ